VIIISNLFTSCGTEEEVGEEQLNLSLSSISVAVGSTITFTSNSTIAGDVTSESTFFVNGTEITGNNFIPSEVNENNEVYATYNGLTSETMTFASTEVTPSAYTQKVLVEDYTGTWCGYCPRMYSILEYMTEYSDNVIPVAIHCNGPGSAGTEDPWVYEFYEEMVDINNYNAQGQPKGKINRIFDLNQYSSQYVCPSSNPEVYTEQLNQYLNQSAQLGLAINSTRSGNSLDIQVKVGFATDNLPDARLVVQLIEDHLTHSQANYLAGSSFPDCIYNQGAYNVNPIPGFPQEHVLLKSYTDVFGDVIPSAQISNGSIYTKDFDVSLPSSVTNPNNLKIVAFVLGNGGEISDREVINAQSAAVGVNQDFD